MENITFEDIKELFREIAVEFKETDRRFKETEARFKETDARFKETEARFKETDAKFKETEAQFKETDARLDRRFKETDKQIKAAYNLFTTQWGRLVETLVDGDLVKILRQKGIDVRETSLNRKGEDFEFDIIAHNGNEIVIVEVKTTLRKDDVDYFLEKLSKAKEWLQEYRQYKIYGAIAYLKEDNSSARLAEKNGLFVIRAVGSSASIINKENFVAKVF